jgi:hypothetical protein
MKGLRRAAIAAVTASSILGGGLPGGATPAEAQLPDGLDPTGSIRFRGEVGSYGEVYSASGGPARRPGSTGRLYLRSDLTLFGGLRVGLDLLYSTEGGSGLGLNGSARRQQLNQIGITPRWSWGRAYVGSFTDRYSSLTWSGVRVQGVGAAIQPGPIRLAAFTGRAQRAVAGGPLDGAFRRRLSGARIGYGRDADDGDGAYVDLVFLRAADDVSSLDPVAPVRGGPTTAAPTNPFAVTPQENVVMAAVSRLPVLDGRVIWTGEAAVSVHSRDIRAPELDGDAVADQPALLRSLITPRASTYGDVAYRTRVDLRRVHLPGSSPSSPRSLTASAGFRYIGAGYVSLGLASLPADQRAAHGAVSVRFPRWSASARGLVQSDNLLGQKLATTGRSHISAGFDYRVTPRLRSSVRTSLSTVANHAAEDDLRIDYRNWSLHATQTLALGQEGVLRSVSVGYGYQDAGDGNPLRATSGFRSHDVSVRGSFHARPGLSVTPSVGIAVSSVGEGAWATRQTYGAATQLRAGDGRWSTTLSLFSSRVPDTDAVRAALTTRYRVTPLDHVTASLRSHHVDGISDGGGAFSEYTFSIGWSRRFQ